MVLVPTVFVLTFYEEVTSKANLHSNADTLPDAQCRALQQCVRFILLQHGFTGEQYWRRRYNFPFLELNDTTPMTSAEPLYVSKKTYVWSHHCLSCKPARNSSSNFTRQLPHSSHHLCLLRATSIIFSMKLPLPPPGRSLKFLRLFMNLSSARDGAQWTPSLQSPSPRGLWALGLENLVQVFTCVLLEMQILLYSQGRSALKFRSPKTNCLCS